MDGYIREWPPLPSTAVADRRGIVNEAAFLLFKVISRLARNNIGEAIRDNVTTSLISSEAYVLSVAAVEPVAPSQSEVREVIALALRLYNFFSPLRDRFGLTLSPAFKGSGILSPCFGDALVGASKLYEIKNGDRPFRSVDFRQIVVYMALDFGARGTVFETIGLLNARRGIHVEVNTEQFARSVSGQSATSLCHLVIEAMSATLISE